MQDGRAVTSSIGTRLMEKRINGSVKLIVADNKVKVLAVPGGATNNSPLSPAGLETSSDDNQKWSFEKNTTGYGIIGSRLGSDLVMTVHGGHGNPGTVVDIYKHGPGSYNQLWTKQTQSDGTFKLISQLGNHVQLTIEVNYW